MDKGIIYGVYWKNGGCLRHFYEMEDAIEWCKNRITEDVGGLYDILRFLEDHTSVRNCIVGYNCGYGNIMDYEVKAIDVY